MLRFHNAAQTDAALAEVVSGARRFGEAVLLPRVLRHTEDLEYRGLVHECVSDWAARNGNRLERIEADVVHLGYTPEMHRDRGKRERNLTLLWRRVEQEPDNAVPLSYIAAELAAARHFDEAAEVSERGWALLPGQPPHRPIRRLCVARAVAALQRGELARVHESVDRAQAHEGPNPDYDYLRGCAWESEGSALPDGDPARLELLRRAVDAYRRTAADLRRGGFVQVMLSSPGEALARLGTALLKLGAWAEAQGAYQEARAAGAREAVRLGEAEARLGLGDPAGALQVLQPIMGKDPGAWALASRAALALGATADAQLFLARARTLMAAPPDGGR
jgi:tetratricopeptide (TPR) repeat protein